jgi:hypothetical protein
MTLSAVRTASIHETRANPVLKKVFFFHLFQMYFIIILITSITASTIMSSIPVVRTSWEPRHVIQSAYGVLEDSESFVSALFTLNTSRPTIRLDNFIQIDSVGCDGSRMTITFDNSSNALLAFNSWSVDRLAFLLGHEHDCSDQVGAFGVLSLQVDDQVLEARVVNLERDEVVDDWHVSISQKPVIMNQNNQFTHASFDAFTNASQSQDHVQTPHQDVQTQNQSHLSKRDLLDNTRLNNPRLHSLYKRSFAKNFTISLDFHPGEALKSVGDPFFWFLGCQYLQCIECYSLGHATMQVEMRGEGMKMKEYKMRLSGEFRANMDLKIMAFPKDEQYIHWDYLGKFSLIGLNIPGVFIIGPQLRLMGAVVTYADTELSADVGFDLYLPFDIEVASKNLSTPPSARNHHSAKFKYHQMNVTKFNPRPTYVGGHLMIAPEIGLGYEMGGHKVLDIAVRLVNQIGFVHRYGNLTKCRDEKPHTEIFHRHKIQSTFTPHAFAGYIFTQYDSEKIPFVCLNCNTCPSDNVFATSQNHVTVSAHDLKFMKVSREFDGVSDSAVFK